MLIFIKFLAKIFSVLNGEISPKQIAAGFAFGALLGLIPAKGLMPVVLLFIAFIININLPMMFVGAGIFKLISFIVDQAANQFGFHLLVNIPGLKGIWTTFYNTPIVPYSNYNNTIVLGSLVVGLIAFLPLYFIASWGVRSYRSTWRERFLKLKIVQIFKASTFYKYYMAYQGMKGE